MLRIGNLQIDMPVVQAALSGYSDLAMRRVARLHGARYALNEVVLGAKNSRPSLGSPPTTTP